MARVLVVEDNEVNLALLQYLLRACGHEVVVATDGIEGLRQLAQARPDLVLCDIEMPRMDGVAFARAARADPATAQVPLLAVTSNAMVGDRARFLAAGFDDYASKPIEPESFLAWVRKHLPGPPLAPAADGGPARPAEHPAPPPGAPLVLVVDDKPANLALKRSCLEPMGYRVLTTSNVDEAIDLALAETPSLIISDVGMPVGDGYDFIARVKQMPALRDVPFIFISSTHRDDIAREKALALGARRFLVRPLPIETLLAEVARALAGRAAPA